MNFSGKRALVLGLGETGFSAARWLKSKGAEVSAADTRSEPPRSIPGMKVYCGPFREEILEGIDLLVLSPGISFQEPLVQKARIAGIDVAGDVELFAREIASRHPAPKVVAITGSNGKSTVTTMVGKICEKSALRTVVAGNIGLPVLDTLEEAADVYVLELSSFQLETLRSLSPDASAALNLSEDHLDRHGTMEEYARAKAAIFAGEGVQVLNREDAAIMAMRLPGRPAFTFGASVPASESEYGIVESAGEKWLAKGARKLMKVSQLKVEGLHNAMNALASFALCEAIGIAGERISAALAEFSGLPHRVEKVCEIGGIRFYDDSKGTNVGATVAALTGLGGTSVVILGGEGKGQDFSLLKPAIEAHARAAVLIGRDAEVIGRSIADAKVPLLRARGMDEAVKMAFDAAREGDAVLLSPACASFDMFRNYAHRAEVFVESCRKLERETCHSR